MHLVDGIADALTAISARDLQGLRAVLDENTVAVPALLEWLVKAIDWELNRRTGSSRKLHDPRATISDQGTRETSLVALALLHVQLRKVAGVTDFFDVTADVLCTTEGVGMAVQLH